MYSFKKVTFFQIELFKTAETFRIMQYHKVGTCSIMLYYNFMLIKTNKSFQKILNAKLFEIRNFLEHVKTRFNLFHLLQIQIWLNNILGTTWKLETKFNN